MKTSTRRTDRNALATLLDTSCLSFVRRGCAQETPFTVETAAAVGVAAGDAERAENAHAYGQIRDGGFVAFA